MAQFYGGVTGRAHTATRLGTKKSGIKAWAGGWKCGGAVYLLHDEATGKDSVRILLTDGSGEGKSKVLFVGSEDRVARILNGEEDV